MVRARRRRNASALRTPVAVDEQATTFVYVDPGLTTDSELRACGVAHAPLRAVLRAPTFAVQIVEIGTSAAAANRADHVLWPLDARRKRLPEGGRPPEGWQGTCTMRCGGGVCPARTDRRNQPAPVA